MKTKTTKRSSLITAINGPEVPAMPAVKRIRKTTTDNGAVSNSTSGVALVDFFGKAGAVRQLPENEIITLFSKAYKEDKTLALKVLFYLADVREGQGERRLFRVLFKWLAENDEFVAANLLQYIPVYTRFDNVLESLEGTELEEEALKFMSNQLRTDLDADNPTLCAKWAPSEQASSDTTRRLAAKLRKYMRLSPKNYRQMLSSLRKQIDVVERKMCEDNWKEIDYEAVPSRASTIYRKAFKKHDEVGYAKFIGAVEKGEKKINAATLYPYDIVRAVKNAGYAADKTLNEQWKALPDYCAKNPHNGLVVADMSGSMTSGAGSVAPIDIAASLALYFADRNTGIFKDHYMIFSHTAQLLKTNGTTIQSKAQDIFQRGEVANTDLQAVFDLILGKAVENDILEKDMPSVLYIVSDMQFDSACSNTTNLKAIQKKYEHAGYKMPKIVFWNANAGKDSPVTVNDQGVCLVSGCSPVLLKSVLSSTTMTPWQVLLDAVNVPRYEPIHA
jgi:hypothetical protein